MDDVAQFLRFVTQFAPHVLEELSVEELDDFVTLMVTFIGSPSYVKNPPPSCEKPKVRACE